MPSIRFDVGFLFALVVSAALVAGCRYEPEQMPEPVPAPSSSSLTYHRESPVADETFASPPEPIDRVAEPEFAEPGPPPPPSEGYAEDSEPVDERATPEQLPAIKTYEVKKGDTLSSISLEQYGTVRRWQEIAEANPGIDPNKMAIGTVLIIPD
ncbi:LysM peptidoglycan-binding domain-containing protein [Mucisphaera calidilacus]|uniref:LysM domain/BON superfamily protein n=1 Tax=Mucisphaera calidilacus TaxID=2527982 RepID=A0A518BUU9_9BACT|nr:LysM peptidoglycan-binding domain-containing protein [Mucisphaera calidilacus]QDU70758.1 LysM domain/BON superfamily protein [Mucisphaera calidilacus]